MELITPCPMSEGCDEIFTTSLFPENRRRFVSAGVQGSALQALFLDAIFPGAYSLKTIGYMSP